MKKIFFLSMIALSAGIAAFIITLVRYEPYIDEETEMIPVRIDTVEEYAKAESSIRINPEAIEKELEKFNDQIEVTEVAKEVSVKPKIEVTFSKPSNGKIITVFSNKELIYSKTLKEWTVHNGVDISGKSGEMINSVCDGKVTNIKYDYKYGNVIEIRNGEYIVKYACVESLKDLKIGDEIKRGQQIAKISDDMGFELDNVTHLHLEILKNGEQINPSSMIYDL